MLPDNVVLFERFCYASVLLGLVYSVMEFPGPPPGMTVDPAAVTVISAVTIAVTALFFFLNVLLIWLTARRASNVARGIFTAFTLLGIVMFAFQIGALSMRNLSAALVLALATMLEAIAVVLIFTGDARDHFA
jgi:hypothetical protein